MAVRVFISHSRGDSHWAEAFAAALKQQGVDAWVDRVNLQPGDSWEAELEFERALRDSDVFVALVGPESLDRPNLNFELGAALGMGKRVVSVVPHDFDEARLPQPLRRHQSLFKDSPEQTAQRLLTAAA
jgi:hypothetical protein